jgi:uncharacterized membrane protein YkvA (DUF1232 family)
MSLTILLRLARAVPKYGRLVYCLYRDPRTPRRWKLGLGLSAGIIVTPFINIPESIPVLGEMETVALLILAIRASLRFVPEELIAEHEAAIAAGTSYFHRDMHQVLEEAGEVRSRIAG